MNTSDSNDSVNETSHEDQCDDVVDFDEEPGDEQELEPPWDAGDARRQEDQFAPPSQPCECYCLHCHRVFMSDQIWFQRVINSRDGFKGFWMCPTPNCSGAGFTFDIFPTDPDHPANSGWYSDDEEDDEDPEYDPSESQFKELEELSAADGSDFEGEEWKFGLAPGEQPPVRESVETARRAHEEEQKMYDEADQRPRTLDWSDRNTDVPGSTGIADDIDDIPF